MEELKLVITSVYSARGDFLGYFGETKVNEQRFFVYKSRDIGEIAQRHLEDSFFCSSGNERKIIRLVDGPHPRKNTGKGYTQKPNSGKFLEELKRLLPNYKIE